MKSKITIKEIAALAQVSIGTVDRVLHNRGRVSEDTRKTIEKIARENNYTSNVNARKLKLNKVFEIGVLIPDEPAFWAKHEEGVNRALDELDFMQVRFFKFDPTDRSDATMIHALGQALDTNLDGLILAPIFHEDNQILKGIINSLDIPVVLMDTMLYGWGEQLTFIGQDAFQSGMTAGHLLSIGGLESVIIVVVNYVKADEAKNTLNARISGMQAFLDKQSSSAKVVRHNLELDNLNIHELVKQLTSFDMEVRIYVPNSRVHIIAKVIKEENLTNRFRLVGHDLIESNRELLLSGEIDFLLHQLPSRQGYLALQSLYKKLVMNREVSSSTYLPIEVVTRCNLPYIDG